MVLDGASRVIGVTPLRSKHDYVRLTGAHPANADVVVRYGLATGNKRPQSRSGPVTLRHSFFAGVVLAAGVATLGVTGCSDVAGVGQQRVSLSIATPKPPTSTVASTISTAIAPELRIIAGNGHTLDLQHAYLTIGDVRLKADEDNDANQADDANDDHGTGGDQSDVENGENDDEKSDATFISGSRTIELPLDGGVITPLDANVPQGTYDKLKADLQTLRLVGTYDNQPFDVTTAIGRKLHMKLQPPLVVQANGAHDNVTLQVDVAHCFVDATGTPIDPSRLNTDPVLNAAVRSCVAKELRAFHDRDRDGDEDHDD